jgi:hypothetical protein
LVKEKVAKLLKPVVLRTKTKNLTEDKESNCYGTEEKETNSSEI